jgi:hypothetical protein
MSGNAAQRKLLGSFARIANFDDRFTGSQQFQRLIENCGENCPKIRVRDISASNP